MRTVFSITLVFASTLILLQPKTHAYIDQSTASPTPTPTVSCFSSSCNDRSAQDFCHFGTVEWWTENNVRRTRYNLYCDPKCLPIDATCWISGFPEPGRNNFIHWTTGKKPKEIYSYDLKKNGYGYVLELAF